MITKEDVKYISALARIHLEDKEVGKLTSNLEDILRYVDQLKKLDVSQVQPTSHVLPLKNVYRPDEVKPSLGQKEALTIAVQQHDGAFKVPQVIE